MIKRTTLIVFLLGFGHLLFSQVSIYPDGTNAECPGEWFGYTANNANDPQCTYNWLVTNGEIYGGTPTENGSQLNGVGPSITLRWDDTTTSGKVKVSTNTCELSSGEGTASVTVPILSLDGVDPDNITGNNAIPVGSVVGQLFYSEYINYLNIGSGDEQSLSTSQYEWEIPSGWTIIKGGSSRKILLQPDNCSGGTIRVRGLNSRCLIGVASEWSADFPVTRTISQPGSITGNDDVVCGSTMPITFEVPEVPEATSYTWTIPPNWTGSSSTRTIILTPNGDDGGNITVKANGCGVSSQISSKTISISLYDTPPTISGGAVVCTTASNYYLNNVPTQQTVTWSVTPSYLVSTASDSGTTANISAANSSSIGPATITFTVSGCSLSEPFSKNVWIGKPSVSGITGQTNPMTYDPVGYTVQADYRSIPTSYNWALVPSWGGNLYDGNLSTCHVVFYEPGPFHLSVYVQNACGSEYEDIYIDVMDEFYMMMSPNPADGEVVISIMSRSEDNALVNDSTWDLEIYDSNQSIKVKKNKVKGVSTKIKTHDWGKGIYIVKVKYKDSDFSGRLLVE